MKKIDLTNLGVQELNAQELSTIDGGNIFRKVGNAIVKGLQAAHDWVSDTFGIDITLGRV